MIANKNKFRPALLIIDRIAGSGGWIAGVDYDKTRKMYLGYIAPTSSYNFSMYNDDIVRMHKLKWFREFHGERRTPSWKIILG